MRKEPAGAGGKLQFSCHHEKWMREGTDEAARHGQPTRGLMHVRNLRRKERTTRSPGSVLLQPILGEGVERITNQKAGPACSCLQRNSCPSNSQR
eukprot:scaffold67546_cov15-Tisochrysis_lutea.AAC.1